MGDREFKVTVNDLKGAVIVADKVSKDTRSRIMKSIKSRSKLEDKVTKALWKRGIRFRKNDKTLYGKPDISIKKYKRVVFIDSCFWHGCEVHGHTPKSNLDYWINKLARNAKRDKEITKFYLEKGWNIKRMWEHEFKKDNFDSAIDEIANFIQIHKSIKGGNE